MQDLVKYQRMCYGDRALLRKAIEPDNWARWVVSVSELCTKPISLLQRLATEIFFTGVWGYGMQDWHLNDRHAEKAAIKIGKKYGVLALQDFEVLDRFLESLNA